MYFPVTVEEELQDLPVNSGAATGGKTQGQQRGQRGFTYIDGTMANCLIIEAYIQTRREQGKSHAVVTTDLRKAFDSVSHWWRSLRRFIVSPILTDYIMKNVTRSSTTIKMGSNTSREIQFS
nr:unnamed protein product [Callosobruchus analis]